MITVAACIAALSLAGWVYLAFFHGHFWSPVLLAPSPAPEIWPDIDIIIPARNEADSIPVCLPSLLAQDYPGAWRILLIDDHSTDNTTEVARSTAARKNQAQRLTVVAAPDLPQGWTGKLAAMQTGIAQSTASHILFTDADILHPADSLRRLASRAVEQKFDLVSLMVRLRCVSTAEKLLIPAFVFFFAMLYPFRRVNDPDSPAAAAAGGVLLVKRSALNNCGGLTAIKSELIDDCALAKAIKTTGGENKTPGRIELSLARDVRSLREYPAIGDVGRMVTRTAFTQLKYSKKLLAGTVIGMGILFLAPAFIPVVSAAASAVTIAMTAWLAMSLLYFPTVNFYRLPFYWIFTLPIAAIIYITATVDSARLYWQGKGGQWKGRAQA